ncbi:ABC transporter permease [Clostridium uliginosum]|uniref:ABC-2 type transport system permease protein n=1 Tax=Clostridium uliginosum TaxID=119641 RepID=A0A1I1N1R1_9CLOT|nr:ABC transporter permease [Clostridium uliginosum]SFC88793.1 ABC-2 type transport system permease protein [Clostridium uliginosum]
MNFSMRRVNALFKKEAKDLSKNINVLFMCLLPMIFCIMYSKLFCDSQEGKLYILNMCLNMNFVLVSGLTIAMMIAEEKEKNTLRTLMLACVSPLEFLVGKAIIILLLSLGTNILMFFIIGMEFSYLGHFIFITTLVVISMMEFGAVVGIIAENQMSTGTIGMPFFMIILIIPLFAKINDACKIVANFLPNCNMEILLNRIFTNEHINMNFTYSIAIILGWIIMGAGVFAYAYSKKRLD